MFEGYFLDLAWLLGALFFGVALGSLTGLIPGFHVNNVALILLALSPALLNLGIPLSAVAAIIVASPEPSQEAVFPSALQEPSIFSLEVFQLSSDRYKAKRGGVRVYQSLLVALNVFCLPTDHSFTSAI